MAVNFLEELVAEWYQYRGYFVRRNILVGKRLKGGHECELDVVAFDPETRHLVHVEPSTDASSWGERERRFTKKFAAGRQYIPGLFPRLLPSNQQLEQYALLVIAPRQTHRTLGGAKVRHVAELLSEIAKYFAGFSMMKAAVPEQYPIIRTLQFVSEYRRHVFDGAS